MTWSDRVRTGPSFGSWPSDSISFSLLLYLRRDFLLLFGYSQSMPVTVVGMSESVAMLDVRTVCCVGISVHLLSPFCTIGQPFFFIVASSDSLCWSIVTRYSSSPNEKMSAAIRWQSLFGTSVTIRSSAG